MAQASIQHVLCAVRGGRESRETVTRAIDLALETGAKLIFFRVMDAEFLEHATVAPLSLVYRELNEVATFALLIVCDRAQRRGVAEVDYEIRAGSFRIQLREFLTQSQVDLLVMGRPTRSPGSNVFKPAEFDAFVSELECETGLRVVTVTPSADASRPDS